MQTDRFGASLSCNAFQLYNFNFNNVDKIQFAVAVPIARLMLDNISFSAAATTVPEPTGFAFMTFGALRAVV